MPQKWPPWNIPCSSTASSTSILLLLLQLNHQVMECLGCTAKKQQVLIFPKSDFLEPWSSGPLLVFWIVTLLCLRCPYCKLAGRAPILGVGGEALYQQETGEKNGWISSNSPSPLHPHLVYFSISSFISISNPTSISIFFPSPTPSSSLSLTPSPSPTSSSISLSSFYPFRTDNFDVVFV